MSSTTASTTPEEYLRSLDRRIRALNKQLKRVEETRARISRGQPVEPEQLEALERVEREGVRAKRDAFVTSRELFVESHPGVVAAADETRAADNGEKIPAAKPEPSTAAATTTASSSSSKPPRPEAEESTGGGKKRAARPKPDATHTTTAAAANAAEPTARKPRASRKSRRAETAGEVRESESETAAPAAKRAEPVAVEPVAQAGEDEPVAKQTGTTIATNVQNQVGAENKTDAADAAAKKSRRRKDKERDSESKEKTEREDRGNDKGKGKGKGKDKGKGKGRGKAGSAADLQDASSTTALPPRAPRVRRDSSSSLSAAPYYAAAERPSDGAAHRIARDDSSTAIADVVAPPSTRARGKRARKGGEAGAKEPSSSSSKPATNGNTRPNKPAETKPSTQVPEQQARPSPAATEPDHTATETVTGTPVPTPEKEAAEHTEPSASINVSTNNNGPVEEEQVVAPPPAAAAAVTTANPSPAVPAKPTIPTVSEVLALVQARVFLASSAVRSALVESGAAGSDADLVALQVFANSISLPPDGCTPVEAHALSMAKLSALCAGVNDGSESPFSYADPFNPTRTLTRTYGELARTMARVSASRVFLEARAAEPALGESFAVPPEAAGAADQDAEAPLDFSGRQGQGQGKNVSMDHIMAGQLPPPEIAFAAAAAHGLSTTNVEDGEGDVEDEDEPIPFQGQYGNEYGLHNQGQGAAGFHQHYNHHHHQQQQHHHQQQFQQQFQQQQQQQQHHQAPQHFHNQHNNGGVDLNAAAYAGYHTGQTPQPFATAQYGHVSPLEGHQGMWSSESLSPTSEASIDGAAIFSSSIAHQAEGVVHPRRAEPQSVKKPEPSLGSAPATEAKAAPEKALAPSETSAKVAAPTPADVTPIGTSDDLTADETITVTTNDTATASAPQQQQQQRGGGGGGGQGRRNGGNGGERRRKPAKEDRPSTIATELAPMTDTAIIFASKGGKDVIAKAQQQGQDQGKADTAKPAGGRSGRGQRAPRGPRRGPKSQQQQQQQQQTA